MTPLVLLYMYCESWFQRKTTTQLKIDWKRPMYKDADLFSISIYFLLLAIVTHALLEFPTRYL